MKASAGTLPKKSRTLRDGLCIESPGRPQSSSPSGQARSTTIEQHIMPPAKQNAGDILRRHESKVRKLYATESIESVKRIMEREPGFPELA